MKDRYDSLTSFIKDVFGENLRVALLVDYLLKGHGAAHVVRMHAKELTSNSYDITVFALESDMQLHVDVTTIGCPSNTYLKAINQIVFPIIVFKNNKFIHKLKDFDLIISYQHTLAWLALFARRKYGIPIVYYNLPVVSDKELFPSLPYRIFMKFNEIMFNYLARKSDYIISISEYAKKVLYENAGISSIVIYLAIDPIFYQKKVDGKLIREKYKLGNSPIILFVGRLVPSKGIHLLIEAFSYVKKEISDAKLIIVGRQTFDDYYQKLERLSKPFKDSIIFTGYVSDEELPYYYAACDVYATASLHEGFNLPAVEAQAYGKPVVAFDIGSHREVVRNGFLVKKGNIKEFANKIIEILEKKRGDKVRIFKPL